MDIRSRFAWYIWVGLVVAYCTSSHNVNKPNKDSVYTKPSAAYMNVSEKVNKNKEEPKQVSKFEQKIGFHSEWTLRNDKWNKYLQNHTKASSYDQDMPKVPKYDIKNYIPSVNRTRIVRSSVALYQTYKDKIDFDGRIWKANAPSNKKQRQGVKRPGRHLLGIDQTGVGDGFGALPIANISGMALFYCPYADFCLLNGSIHPDARSDRGSCCKPCYCDEDCGEHLDCCFDFLDTPKIVETKKMTCVIPITPADYMIEFQAFFKSYYMVDTCLGNDSDHCKSQTVEAWGSLYPVYSPSKATIYYNRNCAICNNVTDGISWTIYASCSQRYTFNDNLFLQGIKDGSCQIQFGRPEGVNIGQLSCYQNVIHSCNDSVVLNDDASIIHKACETVQAPVMQYTNRDVYANVFCKLCNGIKHSPQETCEIEDDDDIRNMRSIESVNTITALINWQLYESRLSMDDLQVNYNTSWKGFCGKLEVKHPYKVSINLSQFDRFLTSL